MMNEELKKNFDILDINTKRNQISDELLIIGELIKNFELQYNVQPISTIKNYDSVNDKDLSESETLTFLYEDIYNIQQELITLLTAISQKNHKESEIWM